MSYSRFTEADVYVYLDSDGYLTCCGCRLQEREWGGELIGARLSCWSCWKSQNHDRGIACAAGDCQASPTEPKVPPRRSVSA